MTEKTGSYNWDDPDRPKWNDNTLHIADYNYLDAEGRIVYQVQRGINDHNGAKVKVFRQRRPNPLPYGDRLEPDQKDDWINRLDGVTLYPYRFPDLLKAAPHVPVFIVEGEAKVEALRDLGRVATCSPGGAGKWPPEFASYLAGRPVVVLPDNDEKGRDHAQDIVRSVSPVATSVRVLELPGLPERGDVVDWIRAGGDAKQLADLLAKCPERLITISASSFAGQPTPARGWLYADLMPDRNVTSLYGDGGLGKTLLALQASVSIVTGTQFLGLPPQRIGPVVFYGCEDELEEVHRRVKDICAAEGIDLATLTDLHIIDMAGKDALLVVENSRKAVLEKTPLFSQLRTTLAEIRPVMLVLDNLADIFGGNEIVKSLARQFIGILRGLAIEFNCVVLLLAHPSQSGRTSGDGTSGNSAWNNSVRQRLYLMPQSDNPEDITDDRIRVLKPMKSNYGPLGWQLELRWDQGRFVLTGPPPVAGSGGRAAKQHRADTVFMALLAEFLERSDKVSPNRSPSYAPTIFAKQPEAKGIGKDQLEQAMYRLLKARRLEIVDVGKGTKTSKGFRIVPSDEVPM